MVRLLRPRLARLALQDLRRRAALDGAGNKLCVALRVAARMAGERKEAALCSYSEQAMPIRTFFHAVRVLGGNGTKF